MHELSEGRAIEHYAYAIDGYLQGWRHGHVSGIVDDPLLPLVVVDVTMYDYRPQSQAVEPDKVRPATTECTAKASRQELNAEAG